MCTCRVGGGKSAQTGTAGRGSFQCGRDALKHCFLMVRSAAVGACMGIIPGLGGSTVEWATYYLARAAAKDSSQFGKGDIRGVVAPESCNNAKDGGSLIPTLLFSVPTSGSMAVLLGGLTILGIEAGPRMVT